MELPIRPNPKPERQTVKDLCADFGELKFNSFIYKSKSQN
jgi:hypothetical protein